MKSSPKIKYLPFSPGIPWEVKGGIIAPKIDYDLLSEIIDKKKITIIAHGGALESFYSLAIIEMLNYNFPNSSLRWSGENCFFELVKLQGIVSDQADSSLKDLVKKYPAPIFLDKKRNVYFNSLNNYLKAKSIASTRSFKNPICLIKQIVSNGLVDWSNKFIPKFRNLNFNSCKGFASWAKINKFSPQKPFVVIFPDVTGYSIHNKQCLRWSLNQLRSFVAFLKQGGVQAVIISNKKSAYLYSSAVVCPFKWSFILILLKKASGVLSKEIDYLLVSNAVSSGRLISLPQKTSFNLNKNNTFLGNKNVIYTSRDLSPNKIADLFLKK